MRISGWITCSTLALFLATVPAANAVCPGVVVEFQTTCDCTGKALQTTACQSCEGDDCPDCSVNTLGRICGGSCYVSFASASCENGNVGKSKGRQTPELLTDSLVISGQGGRCESAQATHK